MKNNDKLTLKCAGYLGGTSLLSQMSPNTYAYYAFSPADAPGSGNKYGIVFDFQYHYRFQMAISIGDRRLYLRVLSATEPITWQGWV